jgi:hypothetical protein
LDGRDKHYEAVRARRSDPAFGQTQEQCCDGYVTTHQRERARVVSSKSTCGSPVALATTRHLRKKATLASGPKFREETPKKGSNPATPIAVLHCKI